MNMLKQRSRFVFILIFLVLISLSCAENPETWWRIGQDELAETLKVVLNQNIAKNVVVFVGDGMSMATVTTARILQGQLDGKTGEEGYLYFEKFPHTGLLKTYSNNMQVSESSASGTALFSGVKTNSETIGVDSFAVPKQCEGSHLHHIDGLLQWAQQAGKSTGIVTTTNICDSTPAVTFAHSPDEDWESDIDVPLDHRNSSTGRCKDIASQLIEDFPGKQINVILGGGRLNFLPDNLNDLESNKTGKRFDKRHLISEWLDQKKLSGCKATYVTNRDQLSNVDTDTEFVLGLFSSDKMEPAINRNETFQEPPLKEMAVKAVQLLQKNPNGFFLMVESGLIDDAHHRGLAARALHETLALDDAVKAVDALTNQKDSLLIVVSDHSHAMVFTGYQKRGWPILGSINSGRVVDQKPYTSLLYVSGKSGAINQPRTNTSGQSTMDKDYSQAAFLPTYWGMHLGEDVPIFAKGPFSHLFSGVHEQHYMAHAVNYAACYRNTTLTACAQGEKNGLDKI